MKVSTTIRIVTVLVAVSGFCGVFPALSQEPGQPAPATPEPNPATLDERFQDFRKLPAPLDVVSGNLLDLEASGYFKIIKAEFQRTNVHSDEALIWTLRVIKPITSRHAILDLAKFRDVRFYRTVTNRLTKQKRELELLYRTMHYAPHLDDGAIALETLDVDESFDVWILVTETEVISLTNRVADTIKLTRDGPERVDRYRTMDQENGNPWAR